MTQEDRPIIRDCIFVFLYIPEHKLAEGFRHGLLDRRHSNMVANDFASATDANYGEVYVFLSTLPEVCEVPLLDGRAPQRYYL